MKFTTVEKSLIGILLYVYSVSLLAQGAINPEQLGPYPVGVTSIQLDDHSRVDPETGGPRQLLTEIWYPAIDAAGDFLPRAGNGLSGAAEPDR